MTAVTELCDSLEEQMWQGRLPTATVDAAKAVFKITASKQLKRLLSHGVNPGDASTELLDELTQHRAGISTCIAMSSPHMQHVVASTGCSHALGMRTLLLKEEITQLR